MLRDAAKPVKQGRPCARDPMVSGLTKAEPFSDLHNLQNWLKTTIFGCFDSQTHHSFHSKTSDLDPEDESIIRRSAVYCAVMSIRLPLHEMTIQEKLAAWKRCGKTCPRSPEAIESSEWHKDILDERRQRVADGTAQFEDWETSNGQDPREAP